MRFFKRIKNVNRRKAALLTFLGFLALEGLFRLTWGNGALFYIYDTDTVDGRCIKLRPGASVRFTGLMEKIPASLMDVNRQGFRGPEAPHRPPAGVMRLAMIGDSYTYGYGVDARQSVPAYLEQTLKTSGRKIEVLNFGVPGMELEDMTTQLTVFAARWQPDLVLVNLFHGPPDLDRSECYFNDSYAMLDGKQVYHDRVDFIWRTMRPSYVLRTFGYLVYFGLRTQIQKNDAAAGRNRPGVILAEQLSVLRAWSVQHGKPVVLVVLDGLLPKASNPKQTFQEIAGNSGLTWLDLGEALKAGGVNPEKFEGDGHFTAKGNRALAETLASLLVSRKDVLRKAVHWPALSPHRFSPIHNGQRRG